MGGKIDRVVPIQGGTPKPVINGVTWGLCVYIYRYIYIYIFIWLYMSIRKFFLEYGFGPPPKTVMIFYPFPSLRAPNLCSIQEIRLKSQRSGATWGCEIGCWMTGCDWGEVHLLKKETKKTCTVVYFSVFTRNWGRFVCVLTLLKIEKTWGNGMCLIPLSCLALINMKR